MVNEKPFKLDMPFKEALRRLAQTDEKELPERIKLKPKKGRRAEARAPRVSLKRTAGSSLKRYFSAASPMAANPLNPMVPYPEIRVHPPVTPVSDNGRTHRFSFVAPSPLTGSRPPAYSLSGV